MTRRKKVKLFDVQTVKSMKIAWKVRRQVQQELLDKKLAQCFLEPQEGQSRLESYPVAMQPMIRDFARRFDEQKRLQNA
jgi:hypothetical protein